MVFSLGGDGGKKKAGDLCASLGSISGPELQQAGFLFRHKRPDRWGTFEPAAGTCHDASLVRHDHLTNAATFRVVRYPPMHRVKESLGGKARANPKEKASRGTLDVPIVSQGLRRAIIRRHETRNQTD